MRTKKDLLATINQLREEQHDLFRACSDWIDLAKAEDWELWDLLLRLDEKIPDGRKAQVELLWKLNHPDE